MAGQRKPYNPNSKYGRKKLREEAYRNYENLPPDQKADHNAWIWIIGIIICIVMFLILGKDGFLKWASH